MDAALRYAVQHAGIPLAVASAAASATPARLLGLADRGLLEPGMRADLVAMSTDLEVVDVMRAGRWLSRR
jgi:N-acetylglucosamine-6-phosphate deacetylase